MKIKVAHVDKTIVLKFETLADAYEWANWMYHEQMKDAESK